MSPVWKKNQYMGLDSQVYWPIHRAGHFDSNNLVRHPWILKIVSFSAYLMHAYTMKITYLQMLSKWNLLQMIISLVKPLILPTSFCYWNLALQSFTIWQWEITMVLLREVWENTIQHSEGLSCNTSRSAKRWGRYCKLNPEECWMVFSHTSRKRTMVNTLS